MQRFDRELWWPPGILQQILGLGSGKPDLPTPSYDIVRDMWPVYCEGEGVRPGIIRFPPGRGVKIRGYLDEVAHGRAREPRGAEPHGGVDEEGPFGKVDSVTLARVSGTGATLMVDELSDDVCRRGTTIILDVHGAIAAHDHTASLQGQWDAGVIWVESEGIPVSLLGNDSVDKDSGVHKVD